MKVTKRNNEINFEINSLSLLKSSLSSKDTNKNLLKIENVESPSDLALKQKYE